MKKIILSVVAAVAGLSVAAIAADRPYALYSVIPAAGSLSVTNAYTAGSAADNLVAQRLTCLVFKLTGAAFTNPAVTVGKASASNSFNFMVCSFSSNDTTRVTNTPPLTFRTGDIITFSVSPAHSNTVVVERHYE